MTDIVGLTWAELKAFKPCARDFARVTKLMGGSQKWGGKKVTAAQARKAGATLEDIIWAASAIARKNPDVERRLQLWMADCSARTLINYEQQFPTDNRVRNAIVIRRAFARGEASRAAWSAANVACNAAKNAADAAWSTTWSALRSDHAARSAADAARSADWGAAWNASDPAWSASCAAWSAASSAADEEREQDWQFDRLILWLGDKEPEDWPLPAKQTKQAA